MAVTSDDHILFAHVGDSRLYRWRRGQLEQLTDDHTVVADMVAAGAISRADAASHEQRFILTRALGVAPDVQMDFGTVDVRPGDRLVLCTDGLYRSLDDTEIAKLLDAGSQQAADALIAAALQAGTTDNVSVVVLTL